MRKVFLLVIAAFVALDVCAQTIEKQTFTYSVKDSDTLRLDRYTVSTADKTQKPCMLFVFGGGFIAGARDKEQYTSFFEYYARKGFVVVSIDYRLGLKKALERGTLDAQTFPMAWIQTLAMAIEDLFDATSYVVGQAGEWGVDPTQIVSCGSSAGAITVLMGEYHRCNGNLLARKLPVGFNYAGVISFAGAIFEEGDELYWRNTPAPIMLFHGDADRNVPYDTVLYEDVAGFFGSKYIAAQLTEKKIPHYFYSVTNTNHSIAVRPMTENRYEIDAFLEKLVFGKQPLIIDTYVNPLDAPEVPKNFTMMDYINSNFTPAN